MDEFYNTIKLNGKSYFGDDLIKFCLDSIEDKSTPEWLKSIYNFILEWLDDSDEIKAHTSGSTGKPKTINLKKNYMIASAMKTIEFFNLQSDHTALLCLSANYIAGKMMIVRAFVGGFNLVLSEPTGNPLKAINEKIEFAAMVPLQVSNSLQEIISGNKVRNIIIGGGVVSSELTEQIKSAKTICYETYGMTETVSHVAIRKLGDEVFKAMPNVSFEKDNRDCLVIDAKDIADSKLITNDIVDLKSKKEFTWLGRYDNIINSGGIKIVPEEIEKKISLLIKGVFFISSIPNEKLGEEIVLVIEESAPYVIESFLSAFNALGKFERPRKISVINQFPFSENNKIKRTELRKILKSSKVIHTHDF